MKKTLLIGGLAALTLAAGGVAVAQQAPRHVARATEPVTQADFVARHVDRLAAADANSDGAVSAEELGAARQARRAEHAGAAFDRLDADKDGSISRAEFEARPQRAHRGPRAGHQSTRPARASRAERGPVAIADVRAKAEQSFARLDADHDGTLTAAEQQAGRQAMREHRRERMSSRRAARATEQSPQTPASE